MPAPRDLTGQKFNRLTAIRCIGVQGQNRAWECRCDCGSIFVAPANRLVFGNTRSCGCLPKEINAARLKKDGYYREKVAAANRSRAIHGEASRGAKTRTYRIWCGLDFRRYDHPTPVCERWGKYETFLADMGECPSPKHTIDRIDNAKGYEPRNCRWATMKEQQNNRTNNRLLTLGNETMPLALWAERTGIKRETIAHRIDDLGWGVSESLTRKPSHKARPGVERSDVKLYTLNGLSLSIRGWSAKTGLSYQMLRQRLLVYDWSVERALTAPPHGG